jgi:hypothetical protein
MEKKRENEWPRKKGTGSQSMMMISSQALSGTTIHTEEDCRDKKLSCSRQKQNYGRDRRKLFLPFEMIMKKNKRHTRDFKPVIPAGKEGHSYLLLLVLLDFSCSSLS